MNIYKNHLTVLKLIASCSHYSTGSILSSNEPIKSSYLKKLTNQSIINGAFMMAMIKDYFHDSKSNFGRLTQRG